MARLEVASADAELDVEHRVLDHGFVRLVDYLGSDARIVQAARVSYGKGTKTRREDRKLIEYLLRNDHTSPFEQVVLTFHIKMPIFVARQWVRHRTARLNEVSGRYSVLPNDFYRPPGHDLRPQSSSNKQGRDPDPLPPEVNDDLLHQLSEETTRAYAQYESYLDSGLAREVARINLPVSIYTEMYWQIDLHNLFHFLKLRLSAHAQQEIRAYGTVIAKLTRAVCPDAYSAFEEHVLGAFRLSVTERRLLTSHVDVDSLPASHPLRDLMARLSADT